MRIFSSIYDKFVDFFSKLVFHPIPREIWEFQYISGQWNHLKQLDELAHYSIIVGYFEYFKHGCSILDVGCGEGILQERLSPHVYSKYVGIDISRVVINQASHKEDEKTFFIRADAENYIPSESFDAIVFNESLYYLSDPLKVLKKFELYLNEDGIFIISMYLCTQSAATWRKLKSVYFILDMTKVTNKLGTSWICMVIPKSREKNKNL